MRKPLLILLALIVATIAGAFALSGHRGHKHHPTAAATHTIPNPTTPAQTTPTVPAYNTPSQSAARHQKGNATDPGAGIGTGYNPNQPPKLGHFFSKVPYSDKQVAINFGPNGYAGGKPELVVQYSGRQSSARAHVAHLLHAAGDNPGEYTIIYVNGS